MPDGHIHFFRCHMVNGPHMSHIPSDLGDSPLCEVLSAFDQMALNAMIGVIFCDRVPIFHYHVWIPRPILYVTLVLHKLVYSLLPRRRFEPSFASFRGTLRRPSRLRAWASFLLSQRLWGLRGGHHNFVGTKEIRKMKTYDSEVTVSVTWAEGSFCCTTKAWYLLYVEAG